MEFIDGIDVALTTTADEETDEETAARGIPRGAMYEIWKLIGGHATTREGSDSDSDDGDEAGLEAFAWRMRGHPRI